jgi:hypothetical protein
LTRRKRAGLAQHLVVLALVALAAYYVAVPRYGVAPVALLGLGAALFWMLFLMPTRCDFEVRARGCRRRVNGKARGCHDHARDKRDAIFAAFRMRNPGLAFRIMWRDQSAVGRAYGDSAADAPNGPLGNAANRSQALFNTASLVVAVVGLSRACWPSSLATSSTASLPRGARLPAR